MPMPSAPSIRLAGRLSLAVAAIAALAGCHSPRGGLLSHPGGSSTYYSSETTQKTVVIIDLRSGEEFFTIDIPPGKQLTFDFVENAGDDPVHTPDLLRYEIWDYPRITGRLTNMLSVPNAASRRIDVFVRQAIEYAEAPPEERLRVDQIQDRPDWWTPRGGPIPERRVRDIYD
jgi:hypothetical protein